MSEPDDLQRYLDEAMRDPEFRALYEDGQERDRVMDALVSLRKRLGLTQQQVADRMEVRQTRVSVIEREGSDPQLSTVQRYARALGVRLRLGLDGEVTG